MGTNTEWSDDLKTSTRQAIEEGRTEFVGDGIQLHMKNIAGGYGYMRLPDLRDGVLRVVDKDTDETISFDSVSSIIRAGWAID